MQPLLKMKHSIYVLQLLANSESPRLKMSSRTVAKCFKELSACKLIEKKRGKFEPTTRALQILKLLEGE